MTNGKRRIDRGRGRRSDGLVHVHNSISRFSTAAERLPRLVNAARAHALAVVLCHARERGFDVFALQLVNGLLSRVQLACAQPLWNTVAAERHLSRFFCVVRVLV